jgi:uncharacterized protein YjbI with pentapeptide repeats
MANEEHLQILMKWGNVWNEWRKSHDEIIPDLSGVDLNQAHLDGLDFHKTDLSGANLSEADLTQADLQYANLYNANLSDAILTYADLRHANLYHATLRDAFIFAALLNNADLRGGDDTGASFEKADLRGAIFSGSVLEGVDFSRTQLHRVKFVDVILRGAILTEAQTFYTVFSGVDLREVKGLDRVNHLTSSDLGHSTLSISEGQLPEVFLRGCGLKDWEIEATKLYRTDLSSNQISELVTKIHELRSDPFIQFNSCFISCSSQDEEFTKRLYTDLQRSGVRCWFAPEHMKIGDRIRRRLDESIRLHDKLLLVLSETSVASQWIEQEVATALEKEREQGCDVLFPVRLDDAIMDVRSDWPALIRNTRHIGDFRQWNDSYEYRKAFARLLHDLRVRA